MITDRAFLAAATVVALVASTIAVVLGFQLHGAQQDLAECTGAKAKLTGQVEEQNRSITGWKETADKAVAGGKVALEAAQALTKAKAGQVKALQELVKTGKATDCGSALATIREGLAK